MKEFLLTYGDFLVDLLFAGGVIACTISLFHTFRAARLLWRDMIDGRGLFDEND